MKRINTITLFFIALIFLSGCVKDEMDINLTQKVAGNLSVTITNSNGIPLVNQKVDLYDYDAVLEDTKTDANGVAAFNNILMGTYYIVMEDAVDGDALYNVMQPVQVINNVTKEYKITPSDFSGSVSITVRDNWTNETIAGINVVVFKSDDLVGDDYQSALHAALFSGITDTNGLVEFEKLPLNIYGLMVYTNSNNYELVWQYFDIYSKGQERILNFYFQQ